MKRIQTLGGLAVFDGTRPLGGNAQQPRRLALLAVLARAGDRGVSRDRLATLLWGDVEADRARRNLNQALYAIRQDLGSEDAILGTRDLRLNPELVEVDVIGFETASASGALEEAARLYAGPFLGDFNLPGVRDFARWAEEERARLAADHRGILEAVAAAAVHRGDSAAAVLWWRRLAALDPTDAQAAQGLMRALETAGDVPGALRHAEIFAALRQEELDLPPDPEVEALAERIRRGARSPAPVAEAPVATVEPPAPVVAVPPAEPALPIPPARPPRRWIAVALAAVAVAALAAGVLRWRSKPPPVLRPSVVVIAPFDVYDSSLQLWHEGLVDLLSRNLDGAGPLSTVPPTVVVRRWAGRADAPSATQLARRTGAGLALYGSLLSAGRDSVRLRATLLDVAGGRALDEWEVADASDRIDRLADSLTVRLLKSLGRSRPIGAVRLAGFRTTSLPVIKAYLQGEQHYRRSEWDSALAYYEHAIELDGNFAPALSRASSTLGWRSRQHSPMLIQYAARAGANNRGLPLRDSLLVEASSQSFALISADALALDQPPEGGDPAWFAGIRRLFATLHEATTRYPDDAEAWFLLGEAESHLGAAIGHSYQQQLRAFDRAIALDSAFTISYLHPIEVAAIFGADSVRSYLRPYLALVPREASVDGTRLVQRLIDSAPGTADPAALFKGLSDDGLIVAALELTRLPDSAEAAVSLARFKAALPGGMMHMHHAVFMNRELGRALMSRGHLRAGAELMGDQDVTAGFAEAALLGAVPVERAGPAFARWLAQPGLPPYVAFPWWAHQRDTVSLRRAGARADSLARVGDADMRPRAAYVAAAAKAYGALARADTSAALEQLLALPEDGCAACYLDRLMLAQLLAERGRDREAWRILQGEHPAATVTSMASEVLWALLRGRVAERLGERERAIQAYGWVAGMWRNADPELRVYVREASKVGRRG